MCDTGPMAQIVCPLVSAEDRARLEAIAADRNRAQKHVRYTRAPPAEPKKSPLRAR
jgi:hypothetical protein